MTGAFIRRRTRSAKACVLATFDFQKKQLGWPDGTMKHAGVRFYVILLDYAQRNAEHDAPEFWERWASNF